MDRDATPAGLRVLVLTWRDGDHPEAGGAEVYVERTSQLLSARGHTVTLFSAEFPGAARSLQRGPVRIVRRGGRLSCYLRGLQYLRSVRDEVDVVVDVHNGVPFWAPLVRRVPVVSLVHHVHRDQWPIIFGPVLGRIGWLVESRLAPLVYRRCRYVTVSQATRDDLAELGVDRDRISITYSGNDIPDDLDTYAGVSRSEAPSLMVLGRLVPHKHFETAIDLVADLGDQFPGLTLDVVGGGYWDEQLRAHAVRRGVADRVRFHGFVDEHTKRLLLARAWVVLLPSHKEGWGLTIVEAGLHGTPSVAFSFAGGVTESIVDDETGLLADDVAQMTTHVAGLLSDERLRAKYGENARRHARSFSWENTTRQLEAALTRAVDRP
ncbi:glycosyltransferase family 4 protein [Phycicoccus sp. HDW14]|uniref:glycosyltransferase family 4 protein n=1 Tax=Phycicoccus sp. HDW14 TaxID=2714941 RepID=UPI00140B76AC|nr:glycosyltransferase family 4 protein [Phycicoccus sp. HDW14]QIM20981.1 glycosyltransferase family 4 protein [Phycicoccus sp. HDW14]